MPLRSRLIRMAAFLAALALAPAPDALAQDPAGLVHYIQGSSLSRVSGAGGPAVQVPGAPSGAYPTDLTYDGRHRYLHGVKVGTIPGVDNDPGTDHAYGDFYLWDEGTGLGTKLTEFRGPVYTPTYFSRTRWSNDRLDSFLSFFIWDTTTGAKHVVRARVSAAEIVAAGATFIPFTAADLAFGGRLEVVATWPDLMDYIWHPDGTAVCYMDTRIDGAHKLRVHPVGDAPMDGDPVLFDQAVTGLRPGGVDVAPDGSRLVVHVATRTRTGGYSTPSGLVNLNPANASWSWLVKDSTSKSGLTRIGGQAFAPDGTGFAFSADRLSSGKVVAKGLYKMSTLDGTLSTLKEVSSSSSGLGVRRWTR